jgi:SpoIVB peptidase S55
MRVPRMRTFRTRLALAAATAAMAVALSPIAVPAAGAATDCTSPPQVFPIADLTRGMQATGLTTIEGTTPTSFTVEILGVMPDYIWLDIDAIVVRITGPQSFLDSIGGVFYGMSGSPVYIGDKLVGAVSYGVSWDPTIFGLTPAQTMVDLLGWSAPSAARLPAEIPFDDATRRAVARSLDISATDIGSGLERLPTYMAVSGLSGAALDRFRQKVARRYPNVVVTSGGSMGAGLPVSNAPFSPGQPVGSVLSWGDFTIWAAGTVTLTCADELVAYGHSLFWDPPGAIQIGMTGAEVLAVGSGSGLWPGDMVPVLTQPRGAFVQDRFSGQVGVVGQTIPSLPVTSSFSSPDTGRSRTGQTDALYIGNWWDSYTVWGHMILNLGAVEQELGPGTLRYDYTITGTREDGTPFTVQNRAMFYSSWGAAYEIWKLVSAYELLASDRWEDVTIASVDATGTITHDRLEGAIARIRTSSGLQPRLADRSVLRARAGSTITVEVTLESVAGGADTVSTFSLRVPRSAHGDQWVTLRGGKDRGYYRDRASSLEELLRQLNGGEHENDLIVTGLGGKVTVEQDVVVSEKGGFAVRVV